MSMPGAWPKEDEEEEEVALNVEIESDAGEVKD